MMIGEAYIQKDYERVRMDRYRNIPRDTNYSDREILIAYELWVAGPFTRDKEWDNYCDARDSVPSGTNAEIRRNRKFLLTH